VPGTYEVTWVDPETLLPFAGTPATTVTCGSGCILHSPLYKFDIIVKLVKRGKGKAMRKKLFALLSLALPAFQAGAVRALEPTLTEAQVACEERQLARLTYRAVAYDGESNLFIWRAGPGGGWYQGLEASGLMIDPLTLDPLRREDQLSFDLLFKTEEDFLNPARRPLPQVTLVRRDRASTLGPPVFGAVWLSFDLAPEVPDPTKPQMPVSITGQLRPGTGQADRAARSILTEDFLTACHDQVSAFDLKMFEILARTVRASSCLAQPDFGCSNFATRFKTYIFRGAEPNTYRMNILRYDVVCLNDDTCSYGEAGIALLFRVTLDEAGRLAGGDVQVLPWCTEVGQTGCTNFLNPSFAVYVMPPLRPSVDQQGPAEFARSAHLNIHFEGSEYNILSAPINWADLLRDTAWNEGTGVPGTAQEVP